MPTLASGTGLESAEETSTGPFLKIYLISIIVVVAKREIEI